MFAMLFFCISWLSYAIGDSIKYEWTNASGLFDDRVSGVNNGTLVITGVRSFDNTTYTCVASNEGGNVTSNVTLIVTGMTTC